MKTIKLLAIFLSLAVLTWNCASKDAEEEAKEEPKNGLEALQKLGEEAERMSKEGPKETVDPKLLKELLPADADGLKRKEASSEKVLRWVLGFRPPKLRTAMTTDRILT